MSRACHRPKQLSNAQLDVLRSMVQAEYPPPQRWGNWHIHSTYGIKNIRCDHEDEYSIVLMRNNYPVVLIMRNGKGIGLADSPSEAWKRIDENPNR